MCLFMFIFHVFKIMEIYNAPNTFPKHVKPVPTPKITTKSPGGIYSYLY